MNKLDEGNRMRILAGLEPLTVIETPDDVLIEAEVVEEAEVEMMPEDTDIAFLVEYQMQQAIVEAASDERKLAAYEKLLKTEYDPRAKGSIEFQIAKLKKRIAKNADDTEESEEKSK